MRIIDRSQVIFALLTYLVTAAYALQVGDRFFLDDSIASELEDWELRWLKDAVRRGKAFVSKGSVQKNGDEDDDWENFARNVQAQNSRAPSRAAAIPASEPSFLGSFEAAPPIVSIGPSGASFAALPGLHAVPAAPSSQDNSGIYNFGNFDPNMFMQPVVVQPQQQHQQEQPPPRPIVPQHHQARPIPRRITTTHRPSTAVPQQHAAGPSSRAEQEPPAADNGDFKSIDSFLMHLISRRQQMLAEEDGDLQLQPTTRATTAAAPKRRKPLRPLKNIITEPEGDATAKKFTDAIRGRKRPATQSPTAPGHPPNEWVMMNPDDEDPEREDRRVPDQLPVPTVLQEQELQQPGLQQEHVVDRADERSLSIDGLHAADPEEERFRLLAIELADLMQQIKKRKREPKVKKKPAKARVIVIRNGTAEGLTSRQYNLVATITLIRDGGKNILVDTGLATDINGRTDMIRRLESLGVPTPAVHVVVATHGHPDHAGNSHIFPDAVHYHGWYVHERTVFNLSNLFDSDREQISPSVSLLRTPGHTSEDVSVLIRDAVDEWGDSLGNVAVSGDVFVRREDIENDREWVPLSADAKTQALSRRTLLCKSDCIVPGHGPPFRVDTKLRERFKC